MSVSPLSEFQPGAYRRLAAAPLSASPLTFQQLSELAERHRHKKLAAAPLEASPLVAERRKSPRRKSPRRKSPVRRRLAAAPVVAAPVAAPLVSERRKSPRRKSPRRKSPVRRLAAAPLDASEMVSQRRRLATHSLDALDGLTSDARKKLTGSKKKKPTATQEEYRDFVTHHFQHFYDKENDGSPQEFMKIIAKSWRQVKDIKTPKKRAGAATRKVNKQAREEKKRYAAVAKAQKKADMAHAKNQKLTELYNKQVKILKEMRAVRKNSSKKTSKKAAGSRKNLMSYLIQF